MTSQESEIETPLRADGDIPEFYEFGRFRLEPTRGALFADGQRVAIGSRAMDLLATLVRAQGEIVSREDLMRIAWPNTMVEASNLSVQMTALRRILGDYKGEPLIVTVSGRGYRFIAPISTNMPRPASIARAPEPVAPVGEPESNLPVPLSRLIGRDEDVARLTTALDAQRLVTVTGTGGIGKTRVALEVAHKLPQARYPDGIWFIDLAALNVGNLVCATIANVLGLRQVADIDPPRLAKYLRSKTALIILDNCEHIIAEVAGVAEQLMRGCPTLKFLATSREPLWIEGEELYPLSPLVCPPDERGMLPSTALEYSAVQLFRERAREAFPGFELGRENIAPTVRICRLTDGIALAIELAAARLRTLTIDELLVGLSDQLAILNRGRRTVLHRQRTLEATIEWSFQLLSVAEKTLFQRLCVFAGSWTGDAAVAVGSDDTLGSAAVRDALAGLVDKSLVVLERSLDAPRYRIFEMTRRFGLNRLGRDADERRRALAAYELTYFERAVEDWEELPDDAWYRRYEPELDNLRASLKWSFGADGDVALGVSLFAVGGILLANLSLHNEHGYWRSIAFTYLEQARGSLSQARLLDLYSFGYTARELAGAGQIVRAGIVDESRRVAPEASIPAARALVLAVLADPRAKDAAQLFERAAALLATAPPCRTRADLLRASGAVLAAGGDYEGARDRFRAAISLGRERGFVSTLELAIVAISEAEFATGAVASAIASLEVLIASAERHRKFYVSLAAAETNLAAYLIAAGDIDAARHYARGSLAKCRDYELRGELLRNVELAAHYAIAAGQPKTAAALVAWADRQYVESGAERSRTDAVLRVKALEALPEAVQATVEPMSEEAVIAVVDSLVGD